MVCHNVTPVYDENNKREFQASSPDEVALVKFVDGLGHTLTHWDESKIVLTSINGNEEEY